MCFPGKPFLAQLLCKGWFLILHSGKYPIQVSTREKYFIEELALFNPPSHEKGAKWFIKNKYSKMK